MIASDRYGGKLYRAINPLYARMPLSGEGASRFGGRFNARGTAALYTSLSIVTAIKEASQAGALQPTTLVSYEACIEPVLDARLPGVLRRYGMSMDSLADPGWRDAMMRDGLAPTQIFARRLAGEGFHGLLVPSFAPGAQQDDLNLVLWAWANSGACRLVLIDEEGRLG